MLLPILLHMKTRSLEAQNCKIKEISEKKQLKILGMKMDSMVIVIFVLTLVIRIWIVVSTEEEVMEAQITKLDVGHVIRLDILLLFVTH